jgi:hypothetical protein
MRPRHWPGRSPDQTAEKYVVESVVCSIAPNEFLHLDFPRSSPYGARPASLHQRCKFRTGASSKGNYEDFQGLRRRRNICQSVFVRIPDERCDADTAGFVDAGVTEKRQAEALAEYHAVGATAAAAIQCHRFKPCRYVDADRKRAHRLWLLEDPCVPCSFWWTRYRMTRMRTSRRSTMRLHVPFQQATRSPLPSIVRWQ